MTQPRENHPEPNSVREKQAARLRALRQTIADHEEQEKFHLLQAEKLRSHFPELARQALETVLTEEGLGVCYSFDDHFSRGSSGDESVGIFPTTDLFWVYEKVRGEEALFTLCPEHAQRVYHDTHPHTGVTTLSIKIENNKLITNLTERDVTNVPKKSIDYPQEVYRHLGLTKY